MNNIDKPYELYTDEVYKVGELVPNEIRIMSIDGRVPDDVYGFVVQIKGDNEYTVQTPDNESIVIEVPEPLDYTLGDEVLDKHVVDHLCLFCGQQMFYNQNEEEYYCPAHD